MAGFIQSRADPWVALIECRATDSCEVLVAELLVEVPQHPVHDIRRKERVAFVFPRDDGRPEALALRSDFPRTPHLNLTVTELPRSLCLYDRTWPDLKLDWSAAAFVERTREWLKLTACGRLHDDDQPLEPILADGLEDIVLPTRTLTDDDGSTTPLSISRTPSGRGKWTYLVESETTPGNTAEPKFVGTVMSSLPRTHGVIMRTPVNLADIDELLREAGTDLITGLRARLRKWSSAQFQDLHDSYLVLILRLPKCRHEGGPVESIEERAFVFLASIEQVGAAIDAWEMQGGSRGTPLTVDETKRGAGIGVVVLNPWRRLAATVAAHLNGASVSDETRVTAIGMGALGSQVLSNVMRAAWGRWQVIDDDVFHPHNAARHALEGIFVGHNKAEAMAGMANRTIDDVHIVDPLVANILTPGDQSEAVATILSEADVILDMSASVAVARHLALEITSLARRISLFLAPSGTGLVLLAEDAHREVMLDSLEMMFYRELVRNERLHGLSKIQGGKIRAGQSCRDTTFQLPQDFVALNAAIASRVLRDAVSRDGPTINVWRVRPETMAVENFQVPIAERFACESGGWTVVTDKAVVDELTGLRESRLPNETGGVFVGHVDNARKILYVVDALPSPPDSEEWPTLYIRGRQGLADAVGLYVDETVGMVEYVGEWHSHPDGHDTAPSHDDNKVLNWLRDYFAPVGRPALIAIVGDNGRVQFHVSG